MVWPLQWSGKNMKNVRVELKFVFTVLMRGLAFVVVSQKYKVYSTMCKEQQCPEFNCVPRCRCKGLMSATCDRLSPGSGHPGSKLYWSALSSAQMHWTVQQCTKLYSAVLFTQAHLCALHTVMFRVKAVWQFACEKTSQGWPDKARVLYLIYYKVH